MHTCTTDHIRPCHRPLTHGSPIYWATLVPHPRGMYLSCLHILVNGCTKGSMCCVTARNLIDREIMVNNSSPRMVWRAVSIRVGRSWVMRRTIESGQLGTKPLPLKGSWRWVLVPWRTCFCVVHNEKAGSFLGPLLAFKERVTCSDKETLDPYSPHWAPLLQGPRALHLCARPRRMQRLSHASLQPSSRLHPWEAVLGQQERACRLVYSSRFSIVMGTVICFETGCSIHGSSS